MPAGCQLAANFYTNTSQCFHVVDSTSEIHTQQYSWESHAPLHCFQALCLEWLFLQCTVGYLAGAIRNLLCSVLWGQNLKISWFLPVHPLVIFFFVSSFQASGRKNALNYDDASACAYTRHLAIGWLLLCKQWLWYQATLAVVFAGSKLTVYPAQPAAASREELEVSFFACYPDRSFL